MFRGTRLPVHCTPLERQTVVGREGYKYLAPLEPRNLLVGCDSSGIGFIIFPLDTRCRSGEIGIRTRLKIWRGQTHVGSSPTSGTKTSKHPRITLERVANPSVCIPFALLTAVAPYLD